jgi:hypothetical protein
MMLPSKKPKRKQPSAKAKAIANQHNRKLRAKAKEEAKPSSEEPPQATDATDTGTPTEATDATDTVASAPTETSETDAPAEETGIETPPEGTKTETTTKRCRRRKDRFQYRPAPPPTDTAAPPAVTNGSAPSQATEATAPPGSANYTFQDVIDEGKALRAKAEKIDDEQGEIQDRLGEIAHEIVYEQKWGNKLKLTAYAKLIDYDSCAVLRRYMSVHRAWHDIPWREFRPQGPILYAVRRALQGHPQRADILRANPNLTPSEARKEMRDYNKKLKGGEDDDTDNEPDKGNADWDKHTAGWYSDFIDKCTKFRGWIIDVKAVPPERKRALLNVEFDLLSVPEEIAEALLKFVADMRLLHTQEEDWNSGEEDAPPTDVASPPVP